MPIIDCHADTLLRLSRDPNYSLRQNSGHIDLLRLRAGGVAAQCFAVFLPPEEQRTDNGLSFFRAQCCRFQALFSAYPDDLVQVCTSTAIRAAQAAGKIGALLTVEDGGCFQTAEQLREAYALGVRMIGLVWNCENALGYPHTDTRGLKPWGLSVLREMNRYHIIPDVSHLSDAGFAAVAAHSTRPFVASHSCARALCPHSRNLSDDQLRQIGASGGLVGVNFYAPFLREGATASRVADVVTHVRHIAAVAGVDAVGFGSDFDGMDSPLEWGDCAGFPRLLDALSPFFTASEIDKIAWGNALRVFDD